MDPINEILEGRYLRQSMEERIEKQDIFNNRRLEMEKHLRDNMRKNIYSNHKMQDVDKPRFGNSSISNFKKLKEQQLLNSVDTAGTNKLARSVTMNTNNALRLKWEN